MKIYTLMFLSVLFAASDCYSKPFEEEVDKATTQPISVSTQYSFSDTFDNHKEKALQIIRYGVSTHKLESLSKMSPKECGELTHLAAQYALEDEKDVDMDHVKAAFKCLHPDDSFNNMAGYSVNEQVSLIGSVVFLDANEFSLREEIKMLESTQTVNQDVQAGERAVLSMDKCVHETCVEPKAPTLLETLTQKRFIVPSALVVGGLLFKYKISGSSFFSTS